uniref:Uncharacterized protein n=1 Tax=uncultured marine type-A Synechococcus 4O4 TaxID=359139 RepID=Q0QM98_9SYNE|nr:conserved hypothetical protein [uncultured marine type-A Synechococcus 4O4]
MRQPEQAEKACCHKDERHELPSNPVQCDRASFQDCPSPMVKGLSDCDRSVVGAFKARRLAAIKKPPSSRGLEHRRSPSPGQRTKDRVCWSVNLKNALDLVGFL